ncbi:hypothetical protein D6C95_08693 [Aureobasidium pullulans]|nr:hypothetical protein D6C95_08693 [Aureobasidium pullulans]
MDSQAPSLASLSSELLVQVRELCSRTDRDAAELSTSLNDAFTRFRMWGYNINAFQHGQASLEHQIREAPSLQRSFRQSLRSLKEDLTDSITKADVMTYTSSSREESMVLALAQDAHIEVLELLKAVQEDISSLFKLSSLVEKVTYRDDYAIVGAAIHDTQILHKELEHVLRQGDDDEVSMEDKIPSIHHSDQISMANVNTPGLGSLQEKDEDDHMSQASRDHSIPEISLNQIPTVHTLTELCQGGEVFVCPYCKDEQTITTEAAWRRHVFSDLKAYVCLAEDCELYMFRSVEAWMNHQLSEHLAVWSCPICRKHHPFPSAQLFRAHMRLDHAADFSEEQLSQLTTSTKHSLDSIRASECQFCDWALILKDADQLASSTGDIYVTLEDYRHHVCSHLEELALTAVITMATVQGLDEDEPEPTPRVATIAMSAYSSSAKSPSSTKNSMPILHQFNIRENG